MKVKLTFKTPDVVEYAIEDYVDSSDDFIGSENAAQDARDEIEVACRKWVTDGEYITIEIDTETGACAVVPVQR